ncbi:TetR/AcrR family transcriptional regulator [Egicoccus sp. AB-alg2]|uniref:TetR/AcrR family transcriptional regulator n=1 Tax=Egicoccus sp. AB-alg2 TaxID=3242693 RepID=UPI00359D94F8
MTGRSQDEVAVASPRQRLLAAADELFFARGIVNTGVDAILDHARVARKTLYHQFGGKDGLVVEYLRTRDRRWTAHWQAAIDAQSTPEGRLLAIFDALDTWEDETRRARGCAFVDALVEVADPSHPATSVVVDHWTAIAGCLRALAADTDADDPDRLAADVELIYRGALSAMMLEPPSVAVERARALAHSRLDVA